MARKSDGILKDKLGIKKVAGILQFFVRKSGNNAVESVLAKYLDDFVITARTESGLNEIRKKLNGAVEVVTCNQ